MSPTEPPHAAPPQTIVDILNAGPQAAEALSEQQVLDLAYPIRYYDADLAGDSAPTGPGVHETWQILRRRLGQIEGQQRQAEEPRRRALLDSLLGCAPTPPGSRPCVGCGRPATMVASRGPTCAECYDEYAD